MNMSNPDNNGTFRIAAEDILPGHPDRVCDAIAESLVSYACQKDKDALVGVEVALHRSMVMITGRVAANDAHGGGPISLPEDTVEQLVVSAFENAGYRGAWEHPVKILTDLDVGGLSEDERSIRGLSDDQGIAVGYATPHTQSQLPVEVELARACKNALAQVRSSNEALLGPDGKVLVSLVSGESALKLSNLNVSIQHVPGLGFADLYDLVLPTLRAAVLGAGIDLEVPDGSDWLRLNGIGDFTCGGPMGDNGLSGKKLVVDHYGPQVPIGGGAICGKDVHKPDRVGALRARQIARRLAATFGQPARVVLGFLPGLEEPDRLDAVLEDGTKLSRTGIESFVNMPDMSLRGSALDLDLATLPWRDIMLTGYFGSGLWGWER